MIPPRDMMLIQITVNNHCEHDCCHCSQLVPHQCNKYDMSLEQVESALISLQGFNGHIGCFGGNPLLHPQFPEICKLYQKYIPVKLRRELWCSGQNYGKYIRIIKETFYDESVAYNEHEDGQECWHQPLQIAIEEVIDDGQLMRDIILNCWVQQRWSAAITPKGAYFCEIAAARAHLLGEPKGLPLEKDWWKWPISTYHKQISELCPKCSACLPMPMKPNDKQEWDDVSPLMFEKLKDSKRPCRVYDLERLKEYYKGHTFEFETDYLLRGGFKDFPDWRPWNYREFKKHEPNNT